MKQTQLKKFGNWGENVAAEYYTGRGFTVMQRNYRCPAGEIDLICSRRNVLYFVEVKARRSTTFGYPEEAITPQKIQRLYRCASHFCTTHHTSQYRQRAFHVCSILNREESIVIRIYTHL